MKKKVLVVTHDAGGSEIIAAYVKKHYAKKDFSVYAAGPGAKVFRRECIPFKEAPLDQDRISAVVSNHIDAEFTLLGTGWMTKIECQALAEAKRIGLKSIVYLESWSGYKERFGFPKTGWSKNLPDEIWVGDKYAVSIAKKNFPKTRIKFAANQYFKNIVSNYKDRASASTRKKILYLSNAASGEEVVLSQLCVLVAARKNESIRIRFHPADDRKRYDGVIDSFKELVRIEKSSEKDIVRDLLQAKLVIGTETVAMVAAVLVGIKTVSITKPGTKNQLPFPKIIRLKKIVSLSGLI